MAGNLIIPLNEVYWGSYSLTAFTLPGASEKAPLVFNVTARLADGNTNPTGSMEWNPAAPAFNRYMQFLKESLDQQIVVKFFYPGGRFIALRFVWAGNSITYGNEMRVVVDLKSELDGLVNPTPRSVSSNSPTESQESLGLVNSLQGMYGIQNKGILLFDPVAEADLKEAKIKAYNRQNQTYAQAVNTLTESNGNIIIATNYAKTVNLTIMSPWSYKGKDGNSGNSKTEVKRPGSTSEIDPTARYGYLLGPQLINTIERQYRWVPPQQSNNNIIGNTTQPVAPTNGAYPALPPPVSPPAPSTSGAQNTGTPAPTAATNQSISGNATVPASSTRPTPSGVINDVDPVGTNKKKILNDEGACRLSVSTLMFPALVGIKPGDIVYVPSLGSEKDIFIEDWIVHGVTYTQTDGGVNLSIEGSRWFGNPDLMQKEPAKPWTALARSLNADPTFTKWQKYAWSLGGK